MSIFDALFDPDAVIVIDEPLSEKDVADIRKLYRECGWRQIDIADHFGVSQPYVSRIVNNKRRKS